LEVKELKLSKFKASFQIWTSFMNNGQTWSYSFSKLLTNSDKPINPYKELLKSACCLQTKHTLPALSLAITERVPLKDPRHYIELGNSLRQELRDILGDDGILLFPSFTCVAPYHNQPLISHSLDFIHFGIINALGLPSTQCPMGLSPEGLPTGVQVVANQNNDHLTIKFAEFLEANLTGWIPPS
jgi:fatty acid amide hydrolase 2